MTHQIWPLVSEEKIVDTRRRRRRRTTTDDGRRTFKGSQKLTLSKAQVSYLVTRLHIWTKNLIFHYVPHQNKHIFKVLTIDDTYDIHLKINQHSMDQITENCHCHSRHSFCSGKEKELWQRNENGFSCFPM